MIEYTSPLTAKLTVDNWEELINPAALSLDEALDILGDAKAMLAAAKKLEGYMKQVSRAKMSDEPEPEYFGTNWSIIVNLRTRKGGLDRDKIVEEMGDNWVEEHSKPPTEYEEIRVKRIV